MKTKRFLSLFIVVILCLSAFTAFAEAGISEETVVESAIHDEYVDYSDMSNWAYWNEGETIC